MTSADNRGTSSILPQPCGEGVPKEGETLAQRITSRARADYRVDHSTGCWVWQKALDRAGYGSYKGKAHRAYFKRAHPDIDITGLDVHHKCRNRACVNPEHLEAVEHSPHLLDHRRGDSELTEAEVAAIRASPLTAKQAAEKYGVTQSLIAHIQTRQTWIGVGPERPLVNCKWCGEPIREGNRNKQYCNETHKARAARAKKQPPTPSRWRNGA